MSVAMTKLIVNRLVDWGACMRSLVQTHWQQSAPIMAETRNVVVLGASYSGLSAAHYFMKHVLPNLPKDAKYHVYLVNPSKQWYVRPAAPRAVASFALMPTNKLFLPIEPGFKQYGDKFTFIHGMVTGIDTAGRKLTFRRGSKAEGEQETLPYYTLIIATGTRTRSPMLSSHNCDESETKAALEAMHEKLKTARSIIVAGGGPAGVETAGEVGEFINGKPGFFAKRPANPKAKITIISGSDKLLPMLRPALAKQAEQYLLRVGVDVLHGCKLASTSETAEGQTKIVLDNGKEMDCDIFIPAMGVTPNTEWLPKELLTEKGYVKMNNSTLRVDAAGPRVYAVGDVGSYTRGGIMDIFDAVPVLLSNVQRDMLAAAKDDAAKPTGGDRPYKPNLKETQLVPIGQSKGVGAMFGYRLPSTMVWAIKGRDYMVGMGSQFVDGTRWNKESKWGPTDG
ncbi:hypothetical protein LTR50_006443 [Elasticomyces elasticus]|nr:hypothetical protein LTR50_006443 [Elasticomyces elasticus]